MVLFLNGWQVRDKDCLWCPKVKVYWRVRKSCFVDTLISSLHPYPGPVNDLVVYNLLIFGFPWDWVCSKVHSCQPSTRHCEFSPNHIALRKSAYRTNLFLIHTGCGFRNIFKSWFATHSDSHSYSLKYVYMCIYINWGEHISGPIIDLI